jgi:hypothetical protein
MKFSRVISRVRWFSFVETNVSKTISVLVLDLLPFLPSLALQPSFGHGLLHKIQLNFLEASQQYSKLVVEENKETPIQISFRT